MSEITHSFAYFTGLPLLGSNITPDGGSAITTCRIVGPITDDDEHRVNEEDENESGQLVGERHDDLKRTINFTIKFPTGFTVPGLNTVFTIAGAGALGNRFNGVWKIAKKPIEFKANGAAELKITAIKNEYFNYVPLD